MTHKPTHESEKAAFNASRSVASGVTWAVMMRWTMRFIGLFSTLVLARLLSPSDFGLVAMGLLIRQLLDDLSEFGTSMYLIRAKDIDRAHCDTAWSITLVQGLIVGLALIALATPASVYYKEPRVVEVIYVLALVSLIGGFENIGPVLLRRDLNFSMDFRFNVYKKILVFLTTVTSAFFLRNYWALVLGQFAGTVAGVALSYFVHSYRPRWSIAHAKEYLRFGMAVVPLRIGNTLQRIVPSFLVAGLGNTAALGSYRVANELASLFTNEIVTPMGRGLLPNYTRLADRPDELSAMYAKVLSMVALLCIPTGIGVAAVATDLTLVLLGPQWGFAAELIKYLAVGAVIYAISQAMVNQILVATGREKPAAVLSWVRLAIAVPILWIGLEIYGVVGLAKATIVASVACLPFIYREARRAVTLSPLTLISLLWRPTIGAITMYLAVKVFHAPHLDLAIVRLSWDVLVGGSVFVATTLALWALAGRPNSAESIAFGEAAKVQRKIRERISR